MKYGLKILVFTMVMVCLFCSPTALALNQNAPKVSEPQGANLGKNKVETSTKNQVVVICDSLFLYQEPSEISEILWLLSFHSEVEFLEQQNGWIKVKKYAMEDGKMQSVIGWLKKDYCIIEPNFFVAMHPTPIRIGSSKERQILEFMETETKLPILYEHQGFYCLSFNGGVGFVEKE